MNPAMWISKTGLQAQDDKLQTIANNLANANTVGFKRDRTVFSDLSYQIEHEPGGQTSVGTISPAGVQLGNGTRLVGTQKVFTAGSLQTTSQTLDVAINGQGFLQIETANGDLAYTRAGQLQLNADGQLVTPSGLLITPPITIPANSTGVTIAENGVVTATLAGKPAPSQIGQLTLASFVNPTGLIALGGQSVPGNRGERAADRRRAGYGGLRKNRAGIVGGVQCFRGGGDGRHDRGAAHLRNEHEGALGRRQHAATPVGGFASMMRVIRRLGLLAGAALLASCKTVLPPEPHTEPPAMPPITPMHKGQSGGYSRWKPRGRWSRTAGRFGPGMRSR